MNSKEIPFTKDSDPDVVPEDSLPTPEQAEQEKILQYGETKKMFVTCHVFCNSPAPLQFQFHSVPESVFLGFLEDVEKGVGIASLVFDLPGGKKKVFEVDASTIVAVDSVISPESGTQEGPAPKKDGPIPLDVQRARKQ